MAESGFYDTVEQDQNIPAKCELGDIVFVGFNSRAAALNRNTGEIVWRWKAPQPFRGYVSMLMLNEEQLVVSVNGYTYCLDPLTGGQRWYNELAGFGTGVASIVALDKHNPLDPTVAAAASANAAAAASAGAG